MCLGLLWAPNGANVSENSDKDIQPINDQRRLHLKSLNISRCNKSIRQGVARHHPICTVQTGSDQQKVETHQRPE